MAFVRLKKVYNNTYAYNVWKEKDENGKWRQKSKYLGVVTDVEKNVLEEAEASRKTGTADIGIRGQLCDKRNYRESWCYPNVEKGIRRNV
jgi:hypothetical protein